MAKSSVRAASLMLMASLTFISGLSVSSHVNFNQLLRVSARLSILTLVVQHMYLAPFPSSTFFLFPWFYRDVSSAVVSLCPCQFYCHWCPFFEFPCMSFSHHWVHLRADQLIVSGVYQNIGCVVMTRAPPVSRSTFSECSASVAAAPPLWSSPSSYLSLQPSLAQYLPI